MGASGQPRAGQGGTDVGSAALRLMVSSQHGLAEGRRHGSAYSRYAAAQLAVLRAAAAVLSARRVPGRASHSLPPRSLWELLPEAEPTLSGWAAHFAAGSRNRAAIEAGLAPSVSRREANELLCDAETFVALAAEALGIREHSIHGEPRVTAPYTTWGLRVWYRCIRHRRRQERRRLAGTVR